MSEKNGNSAHNNSFNGTDTAPLSPDANASDNAQTTANKRIPATNPGTRIPAFAKRVHTAPALTAAHAASKNTQGSISFSGSPLRTIKNDNPIKRITHIRLPASTPVPTAPKSDRPALSLFAKVFIAFSCNPPKVAYFQIFLLTQLDFCGSLFQQFNITYLLRVPARLLKEPEQVFDFLIAT